MLPTILALAGVDAQQSFDGKSLLPLYDDPEATIHDALPLVNVWGPRAVHSLSVVTRDWKYIYWPYAEDEFQPTEELYDLVEDPLELRNVVGQGDAESALIQMRERYDRQVNDWKTSAVPYHNYWPFGAFLSRKMAPNSPAP